MKDGLQFPEMLCHSELKKFKNDPQKHAIERRIAMFKKNNISFEKMLDKWKKSGHTLEAGDKLILNIRGEE